MLIEKQKQVLKAIYQYVQANGINPTIRNIGDLVGIRSKATVHNYIKILEKEGLITRKETIPRLIVITEKGLELI